MKACINNLVGALALVAVASTTAVASPQTPTKPAQRTLLSHDPFAFLEESSFDFYQNILVTGFWFTPGWTFYGAPSVSNQPVVVMGPVQNDAPVVAAAPVAPPTQSDGYFYEYSSSSASFATIGSVNSEASPTTVVLASSQNEPPALTGLQVSPIAVTKQPRPIILPPPPVNNQPIISQP